MKTALLWALIALAVALGYGTSAYDYKDGGSPIPDCLGPCPK